MTDTRKSRRVILDLLKQEGPQSAGALAEALGVSAMAVRLHLYELRDQGLIVADSAPRPVGRPVKLWRLTQQADAFFPNGHATLVTELIGGMRAAFGDDGLDRIVVLRAEGQVAGYRRALAAASDLRGRLDALAIERTREGYMARVEPLDVGDGFLFVENHCPVCAAARACSGLCRSELAVFRAALGDDVTVERTDHILAGARRCAYRVSPCAARTESADE